MPQAPGLDGRTYVRIEHKPVFACLVIPAFELKATMGRAAGPAVLAPVAGAGPAIGAVTAAAEALGVREGMRLGEALSTCPELVLVERDPAAAEEAWEKVLRALESAGLVLEPHGLGLVYFESFGVERLYGGLEPVLWRALAAVGTAWEPRAGAGGRRFVAFAAMASSARPGQVVIVPRAETAAFLEPLPLELLPLEPRRRRELHELGIATLGELAALPRSAVADRLGVDGLSAWRLVRGTKEARVVGRRPTAEIVEAIAFPEAVGNEQTLGRAVAVLLERLVGAGPSGSGGSCARSGSRRVWNRAVPGGGRRHCVSRRASRGGCSWRWRRSWPSCRRQSWSYVASWPS